MAFVDEGGARGHGLRFGWPPEDRPGHKKGRKPRFCWAGLRWTTSDYHVVAMGGLEPPTPAL
jgi:hypothetical protein